MKAVTYDHPGKAQVLEYRNVPEPVCAGNEVIIQVRAIAIEGGDIVRRASEIPEYQQFILGYAAAGEIIDKGCEVQNLQLGQRVTTMGMDSAYAKRRSVAAEHVWPIPANLDFERAAAVPIAFGTANHCLFRVGQLKADEKVLIQAGAGGVGLAAIQLAHQAGAQVLATVSGEKRIQRLASLGLDDAIDYRQTNVAEEVLRLTQGQGVELAIDPVGSTLKDSLESLASHGRLVFVGNAGGEDLTLDLWPALQANIKLLGVFMGPEFSHPAVYDDVLRLLGRIADGGLEVLIDRSFSLSDAVGAHEYIESSSVLGRVVMVP